MDQEIARQKHEVLVSILKKIRSLVVAFSGGVDSSYLLAVAHDILKEKVIAATAESMIHPLKEIEEAGNFAHNRDIRHIVFKSTEMEIHDFVKNGPDRCFHCKQQMARALFAIAAKEGIKHVAHGANVDDLSDYRPGFKAAQKAGMIAPLIDAGLAKDEIRFLSRNLGLSTWDRPQMACLASRIPYGSTITEEKLMMIDQAENFLLEQGLKEVRVRHHESVARIEAPGQEVEKLVSGKLKHAVVEEFHRIGFNHIAVDLEGYVPGKMNRDLEKRQEI